MRLERLAGRLRLLTWAAALLVLALPALSWDGQAAAEPGADAWRLALATPPYLAVAWGLLQLSGFYRRLAQGEQFTPAAAAGLRRFGLGLLAAALLLLPCRILAILYRAPMADLASLVEAVLRPVPVAATALGAILGLILIVLARLLDQATEIAEENASFL